MNKIFIVVLTAFLVSCGSSSASDSQIVPEKAVEAVKQDSLQKKLNADSVYQDIEITTMAQARKLLSDSASLYEGSIIPRMLDEVPEYAFKLLNNKLPGFIVVDKATMKVIFYNRHGQPQLCYGMACSKYYGNKHKKGDNRTPEGFFEVEGIYDSTDWLYTNDFGVTSPVKGQFGPRFIRVKAPMTSQIGIHGTCAPGSIGGRRSHGCVRILNKNILELVKYAKKGMPLIISPGPKDLAVNEKEGCYVPAITTGDVRPTAGTLPDDSRINVPESVTAKDTASIDTTATIQTIVEHPDSTVRVETPDNSHVIAEPDSI